MGVTELGHIVLSVRDADASRGFYGDMLGWPVVASVDLGAARAVAFSAGRTHHELLLIEVGPDAAPATPSLGHATPRTRSSHAHDRQLARKVVSPGEGRDRPGS